MFNERMAGLFVLIVAFPLALLIILVMSAYGLLESPLTIRKILGWMVVVGALLTLLMAIARLY